MKGINLKSFDAVSLANPGVRELQPYQPGKPIESLERELGLKNIIKLASNENPFGPSLKVTEALKAHMNQLQLYPDANGLQLKEAIAACEKVSVDDITLGNGSENVVELLIRAFCEPHDEIIVSQYAFIAYQIIAKGLNVGVNQVPANQYQHDLEAMLAAITPKTKIIFVVNPNNPTGTYLTQTQISSFLESVPKNVLVVVDEAYVDYMHGVPDYVSAANWLDDYDNLIVTRTFSKAYGLAGLRIGYGLSHPLVANLLNRIRQPFNVNSLALVGALAALEDRAHLDKTLKTNQTALKLLSQHFEKMGVSFIPSHANFILVDLKQSSLPIFEGLLQVGIITRPLLPYGLPNHLRISTGTLEQTQIFLKAFSEILHYEECVSE